MLNSYTTPARVFSPGMGDAVAERTVARLLSHAGGRVLNADEAKNAIKGGFGYREKWADVALRVARGNVSLINGRSENAVLEHEFHVMHHHLRRATLLMSGRHLQHGDENQASRNLEVFTNCATSATTFLNFYLLLNGSGVGRAYDDLMMKVDWRNMPLVVCVIDQTHGDVQTGEIKAIDVNTATHFYANRERIYYRVPDSREGWAKAIEHIELLAFEAKRRDAVLILDFSDVRKKGSPIGGMQNRPASGPGPLMAAIEEIAKLRDAGMAPWRSTLYADHYSAKCVLVGGARRAARMSTKNWRDKSVLEFIAVKCPLTPGGESFLWSSNNSVTVDAKFWRYVKKVQKILDKHRGLSVDDLVDRCKISELEAHAFKVFEAVVEHSYKDGTGEPGFINQDRLPFNPAGIEALMDGDFAESARYKLEDGSKKLTATLAKAFVKSPYKLITNPCGEIQLTMLGGYCVIADVVPYHAAPAGTFEILAAKKSVPGSTYKAWDDEAESAFRTAARALIRTNLMDSLYGKEVARTNRIGVGFTGFHEYAWARFGFGWKDIVNEKVSIELWRTMSRFSRAVKAESREYAASLGVVVPHTDTTVKPAGTTSKLFGMTEGAHLASMREYLRWVQFRSDDPLIADYKAKGYPVRELKTYTGTTIVGFPTAPLICTLGMGDKLVTAGDATPEEQYEYLRLLEKWWIVGCDENDQPLVDTGNQVSYTLKYKPGLVSYEEFRRTLLEGQSTIRCCSVMPQTDDNSSAYEYLPEEPVNKAQFELIAAAIKEAVKEDVDLAHVDCSSGACPIDFNKKAA